MLQALIVFTYLVFLFSPLIFSQSPLSPDHKHTCLNLCISNIQDTPRQLKLRDRATRGFSMLHNESGSSTYLLPRPSGVWGETLEWWPLSQTSDRQTGGQESEVSQELHESMKVRLCLMTDTTGILGTMTNPISPHWELPLPRRGPNILFRWTQTLRGNAQEKSMNQNMKFGDRVLYWDPGFIIYLLYGLEKFI